jgi:hypothetical protein
MPYLDQTRLHEQTKSLPMSIFLCRRTNEAPLYDESWPFQEIYQIYHHLLDSSFSRIVQEIILLHRREILYHQQKELNASGDLFKRVFKKNEKSWDLFPLSEVVIKVEEMSGHIAYTSDLFKD